MLYDIDIVGTCNLRCPSCPVGNYSDTLRALPSSERPRGLMKLEMFEQILDKIVKEHGSTNAVVVSLFIWGEPLLHPKIGQFISAVNARGFTSSVSTNLNVKKGLEDVVRAAPGRLRISLSGANQDTYGITHAEGSVELVKANARKLRDLMDQYNKQFLVEMHYHLYKHNIFKDVLEIKRLCQELGFEFNPGEAFFMPLEKCFDLAEGKPPAAADLDTLNQLLVSPLERAAIAKKYPISDCVLRSQQVAINCDGSVSLCCGTYDPSNIVAGNYLDTTFENLQRLRYEHPTCKRCFNHGFAHKGYVGVGQDGEEIKALAEKRIRELGGEWRVLHLRHAFRKQRFISAVRSTLKGIGLLPAARFVVKRISYLRK